MTRRTSEEWQRLIDEQAVSEMTIQQFCQSRNINQSTFYLQRKKRSDSHLAQAPSQWLPIDTKSMALPETRQWQIELTLPNGVVLNMSTDG
ncbi:IS66 family insertion sequence element accessory protein TnpA [Ningiella sp. W23]|uniref:IS66 family insertion sequence element accessory protein TnpA n=1 Tax=Ningiella sp. W23 TaxID=3023715 RepID=UPI0037573E67